MVHYVYALNCDSLFHVNGSDADDFHQWLFPHGGHIQYCTGTGEFASIRAMPLGSRPTLFILHLTEVPTAQQLDTIIDYWTKCFCATLNRIVCSEIPTNEDPLTVGELTARCSMKGVVYRSFQYTKESQRDMVDLLRAMASQESFREW